MNRDDAGDDDDDDNDDHNDDDDKLVMVMAEAQERVAVWYSWSLDTNVRWQWPIEIMIDG